MKKILRIGILVILMLQILTTVALAIPESDGIVDQLGSKRSWGASLYSGGGAGIHRVC